MKEKIIYCFILFVAAWSCNMVPVRAQGETYVTREGFEADKLASIWLLKRFVDRQAEFVFTADGAPLAAGVPFDVPEASLRRFSTRSTFETILTYYKIQDSALLFIGQLLHDIEINTWEKKRFQETSDMQLAIGMIIKGGVGRDEIVTKGVAYFDELYESLIKQP